MDPVVVTSKSESSAENSAESSPERPDKDLVDRARAGDQEAFGELVKRHQGRVYRLALRVLKDEEKARDAAQDAFIKVYGSLDKFEGRSRFTTWLHRLVVNLCLDALRRDKSSRHVEWEDERRVAPEDWTPVAGDLAGPAVARERSEYRKLLGEAIEALPEDARRTLILREVDGLSYAEIAEIMGIPKGTVMSRLHYARKRARELLTEAGVSLSGDSAGSDDD